MKIRLIIASDYGNGENETILFTEDFEEEVASFLLPGQSVDYDVVIEADLPSGFPTEDLFKKNYL